MNATAKKSLSIKIPVTIAQLMDDNAQLNPIFLSDFIWRELDNADNLKEPISERCYTYTFKVDSKLHKWVKLKSIELDLPINELIGRMLVAELTTNNGDGQHV